MNKVKKILAALIVMTLVASSFTVGAATKSPEKKDLDPAKTTFTVASAELVYNGSDQVVDFTVTFDGVTLKEGTDYVAVKPKVNKPGTYTVEAKIEGIGLYKGVVAKTITVTVKEAATTKAPETKPAAPGKVKVKKATKKKSAKKLTVKIKKQKAVKGYQVFVYKNKKKAKKNKKAIVKKFVKKNKAKLVIKNKKLKKKKKLYVRVRAYKIFNGKKIYGKLSKVKKVKVKK